MALYDVHVISQLHEVYEVEAESEEEALSLWSERDPFVSEVEFVEDYYAVEVDDADAW